jgi:putative ABC transport system substrate-binding protein
LVGLNVDVIVTYGSGVPAASHATTTIPIVFASATDVVATGLIASLARPGGNVTGLTFFAPELYAKRLELLKTAAPTATRTALLFRRSSPSKAHVIDVVEDTAKMLNIELRAIEVGELDELERAFSIAGSESVDSVVITDQALFLSNAAEVAAFAEKRGLPAIGAPIVAANGALMGYGVEFGPMFRYAAVFVDKILKGAAPGEIPIEQATKFNMVVNLKTARALAIEIPAMLLARADEVIE